MQDLKCFYSWLCKCFIRKKIHLTSLLDLEDAHNAIWWVILSIHKTSTGHLLLLFTKSLPFKKITSASSDPCVCCSIRFDWQRPANRGGHPQHSDQVLIKMLPNPDWCVEVRDVTPFQLNPTQFKPVRRARRKAPIQKSFKWNNQNFCRKSVSWIPSLVVRSRWENMFLKPTSCSIRIKCFQGKRHIVIESCLLYSRLFGNVRMKSWKLE